MSYQVKLRTNIKRDDQKTSATSADRYVQGTYSKNGWNWQRPAIEEKIKPSTQGTVFIFADGMDGETSKEKSAELAIKAVQAHFENMEEIPDSDAGKNEEIQRAFLEAHHAVVEDIKTHPERDGMGTNLFVHWFNENKSYLGWNSLNNFYLFRNDKLEKIEGKPFHIWSFVDKTAITSSDEVHHSLGDKNHPPRIYTTSEPIELKVDDRLLYSSHEYHNKVSHDTIEGIMRDEPEIRDTPSKLIEAANDINAKDDNSVWIIDIREVKKRRKGFSLFGQRISNAAASIAAGILLAATGGGLFWSNQNKPAKEPTAQTNHISTSPPNIKKNSTTATNAATSNEENTNTNENTTTPSSDDNRAADANKNKNTSVVSPNIPTSYSNTGNTAKGGDIINNINNINKINDAKRRKEMQQKLVNWNDKKFKLHKKMTALEAFLPDNNTKALTELNSLQKRKGKLLKDFMQLIKLDKNKQPIYGKNNSVQLRDDIPTKTVENKFWSLYHQLNNLDNDFEVLCKENYCTME